MNLVWPFLIAAVALPELAGSGSAPAVAGGPPTLADLRARYNPRLLQGLVRMRAKGSTAQDAVVGDNTDGAGMSWTKCTNLGLDLLGTLVAEERGLMTSLEAREHLRKVLDVLGGLRTYHGIFPEIILMDGGLRAEVKEGRIRYSSIDSAWVTVALTLVQARYQDRAGDEAELAARAQGLLAAQDYGVFVGPDGLLGAGLWVDAKTYKASDSFGFSYGDLNSEARPLVLALVGMGKLPGSTFDNMRATWTVKEGLPVIQGWHWSAFVEMTGALWLDEMALAPLSLGLSHTNYLEATTRVARRLGHRVWGYAPACDPERGYSEYGLDRAALVSPYAGGLLAITGDRRASANLERILGGLADDGRPLPDGLDPGTGRVVCNVARTLDQSLLFLSLNSDALQALARRTAWYASAEQRTRALDHSRQPPSHLRTAATPPRPAGATLDPAREGGARLAGLMADVRRSDAKSGGSTDLARSELHLASATAVRGWADFLPDLGLAIRHPFNTSLIDPSWRVILQAQAAFSLDKLWTALAAGDAAAAAEASVHQHQRQASARGLEAYFALYLAERRVALLREHRASLATFASGLSAGGKAEALDDLVLFRSRLSTIDAAIAEAEAARQLALGRLRTLAGAVIAHSGLDPRLDLASVLGLEGVVARDADQTDEARAIAEIEQHRSLLVREASRALHAPELRAGAFVDIPRVERWAVDSVTGSLTLAFGVHPGQGRAREAQTSALETRLHRLDQLRQTRAARVVEARARLHARLGAWSSHPEAIAEALYRDAGERLKRGEVDLGTLIAASRALVDSREGAERTFGEAVKAGIALGALGVRPLSDAASGGGATSIPATLSPGGAEAAGHRGLASAPELRAAQAEATRARAEAARTQLDSWHLGLETGVAYPLHTRSGAVLDETTRPPMPLGTIPVATDVIREPSLLGRLRLELKGNREAAQAAGAEAELRAAEEELALKNHLARRAGARLDLAFARTLARAAGKLAALGAEQLRLAQQMQSEGLTDEKNAVREAELQATTARARSMEADEAVEQAAARTNRFLGRPVEAPLSIDETPEQLMAWLRQTHYPSSGLVGYRHELGARIAALEQRHAQTRLSALRHPASAFDVIVQATQQLRGYGRSVGVALGFRLDPVRNQAQILEAARLAGEAEGRIRGEADRIEGERRVAHAEREAAERARALALASRDRLARILEDLRKNQAALTELNPSAKARSLGRVEAQLHEAELSAIAASARLARAELAVLELSVPGQRPATTAIAPPVTATLATAVDRLAASNAERDAAAGAARHVALEEDRQPPGLLAGLHLAGPILGASYGVGRFTVVPRSRVTVIDADAFLLAGITQNFAESLAFLGTGHQVRAAEQAAAAAHRRAEVRALADLGDLWSAREQTRSAARIAAESRRRLVDLAIPRYNAAQISAESLARTAAAAGDADAAQSAAEGLERKQRAALAARGLTVSDQVLDELGRRTDPRTAGEAQVGLDRWKQTELASGAGAAARERQEAAEAETGLAYAGLLGPTTLLLELDPQWRRSTVEAEAAAGAPATTRQRALTWVSSLFVPLRLKALADGGEAGARADVRRAEAAAAERALTASFGEMRLRLSVATDAWRAAERAQKDATLAFAEVDRRYRRALGGADANSHARAEDDLFASENRARAARSALTTLLAPLQRQPP
jgi:hypothetical protein